MALDIIGYISDNVSLTTQQKIDMLESFCEQYGYQENVEDPDTGEEIPNPVTRKAFANQKIEQFVRETVNAVRKRRAEAVVLYEELELE